MEVKVEEGVDVLVDHKDDVATATSVGTVRTAERFELLAVYGGATIAAFSSADVQHNTVNESGHDCRILPQSIAGLTR